MSNVNTAPTSATPAAPLGNYHMSSGGNMKWFKFIIYFQLFASGVSCILNMLLVFEVNTYPINFPQSFYNWCYFYALSMFALGPISFIIRSKLAKFHHRGPALYIGYLIANAVVNFISSIWIFGIINGISPLLGSELFLSIAVSGVIGFVVDLLFILLNDTYFRKRRHLFVN